LTIRRLEEPLRHEVVGNGYRAKRDELLDHIRQARLPKDPDMPIRQVREIARAAGISFKNDTLNKTMWDRYCALPDEFQIVAMEGA
jgi:hypothetical protein